MHADATESTATADPHSPIRGITNILANNQLVLLYPISNSLRTEMENVFPLSRTSEKSIFSANSQTALPSVDK